jgi:transposase-like protein
MPSKANPEEREKAINKYLRGDERAVQLAAKLGMDRNNFCRWVRRYLAEGIEGLREQ